MDFISQFPNLGNIDTTYSVNSSAYDSEDVDFELGYPVVISYKVESLEVSIRSNVEAELFVILIDEADDYTEFKQTEIQKLSQGLTSTLSTDVASIPVIASFVEFLLEENSLSTTLIFENLEPSHAYVCYITMSSLEQGTRFQDPIEAIYMTTDSVTNYIILSGQLASIAQSLLFGLIFAQILNY